MTLSFIMDSAMGQIPRSTERIFSFVNVYTIVIVYTCTDVQAHIAIMLLMTSTSKYKPKDPERARSCGSINVTVCTLWYCRFENKYLFHENEHLLLARFASHFSTKQPGLLSRPFL